MSTVNNDGGSLYPAGYLTDLTAQPGPSEPVLPTVVLPIDTDSEGGQGSDEELGDVRIDLSAELEKPEALLNKRKRQRPIYKGNPCLSPIPNQSNRSIPYWLSLIMLTIQYLLCFY